MEPFSIGSLWLQPGKTGGYVEVMVLQDVSWDFRFDLKELHGARQFPVAVKRGKGTIEGSAQYARLRSDVIAAVLGGLDANGVPNPATTGQTKIGVTTAAPPSGSPPTTTVTPPNNGVFLGNISVYNTVTKDLMKLVGLGLADDPDEYEFAISAPSAVYTFDTGFNQAVVITYKYTVAEADIDGAHYVTINNEDLGSTPVMRGIFKVPDNERQLVLELEQVVPGGIKFSSAIDDWTKHDLPLRAFADCNNLIGKISITDREAC